MRRAAPWVLLAVLASAGAARAQDLRTAADYLKRIDQDGDARVSPVEYVAWMSRGFEAMDRDRDGMLTREELPGRRGGPIRRDEHRAGLLERFHKQDADRDGFIDAGELAAPPR